MNEDILRLDIPMYNTLNMHIFQRLTHLPYNTCYLLFGHFPPAISLGHAAVAHVLNNQIDIVLIIKEPKQAGNMPMREVGLYLDLSHYQLLCVLLFDLLFGEFFQYADEADVFLAGEVDVAECPPPQALFDLEVL